MVVQENMHSQIRRPLKDGVSEEGLGVVVISTRRWMIVGDRIKKKATICSEDKMLVVET